MLATGASRFEPVAVIGLGCVLPDAPDVASFWRILAEGRSCIREVPKDRWDAGMYWSDDRREADKTYSKIGSFVEGYQFDWRRFRVPPKMMEHVDLTQQWAIEAAGQALRDAGYDAKPFDRSRTAVVLGNAGGGETRVANSLRVYFGYTLSALRATPAFQRLLESERHAFEAEFEQRFKAGLPVVNEDSLPGELSNVISGRVASVFNLTGKNFTVDAACASSMAALDVACHALQTRQCDLVLTGGSDHMQEVSLYVKFCRLGALSATGSRPFDEQADGFVMGEGCGILLLKRLEDARRDGDRVYAVIAGIGCSSDGGGKALVAPKVEGQVSAIQSALASAAIGPDGVDLVECHGTGTVVGDATEITALRAVFGGVNHGRRIAIGSVKSNLGHLKSAAGVAAILKTILALHHRTLPATIGVKRPNPALGADGPLRLQLAAEPWAVTPGRPRRAGVSGFGFGGTNFHIIVEEAPTQAAPTTEQRIIDIVQRVKPGGAGPGGELELAPAERVQLVAMLRDHLGMSRDEPIPLSVTGDMKTLTNHVRAAAERRA